MLKERVVLITGATRGIGEAMAHLFAQHGARVGVLGKTEEPHPKLPGTIHSVVADIEQAGGQALALACDVRDEEAVAKAVKGLVSHYGRLDVLVNNASAIHLKPIEEIEMKRYDLMMDVNVRGTFLCSKHALPHLVQSDNGHIITLSPPLNIDAKWFKHHLAYTMSKFSMSFCTLGLAQQYKGRVSINSLWPRTTIATAAIANNFPPDMLAASRKPAVVAEAALALITQKNPPSGEFLVDESLLRAQGEVDFDKYAVDPTKKLIPDLFLE